MRSDEEGIGAADNVGPGDDAVTAAIAGQLLMALKMRSEDLERSSSASDADAPVADELELDLTHNMQRPAQPEPEGPAFYHEHNIAPATLPTASGPSRDPGVTFDGLSKDCQPVGILELSLVSTTTEIPEGKTSVSLHVSELLLSGRLMEAGEPADLGESHGVRLHMQDVTGKDLHLVVDGAGSAGMSAQEFAAHVALKFPKGTSVAFSGFDLIVLANSFMVIVDKSKDDAAVSCLGDDALPPVHLFQIGVQCTLLAKAKQFNAMAARSIDGLKEARPVLGRTVVPLLTNLAVAHLRLGQDSLALAYAVALQQLLFQATPAKAACIVARIMQEAGHSEAACAATVMGHFDDGDPLEWVEAVGNEGFKVLARVGELSIDDHAKKAVKAGLRQIAEALVDTQGTWMDHALGNADAVERVAAQAQHRHGKEAAKKLKQEGDRLFQSGAAARISFFMKSKTQKAILKWRAALWLHLDKEHDLSGYSAWDILDTRHRHWGEAMEDLEPAVLRFLDLTALAMMRASHVNATALRHGLLKVSCSLDRWQAALGSALEECMAGLDIM